MQNLDFAGTHGRGGRQSDRAYGDRDQGSFHEFSSRRVVLMPFDFVSRRLRRGRGAYYTRALRLREALVELPDAGIRWHQRLE